jgi:hypothetical protein
MVISLAGFTYIYYHTAKSNINLSKINKKLEENESFENSPPLPKNKNNYNTEQYAYSQPQHNDRRDMNKIFNTQPLTETPFLKTGYVPVSYASDTVSL